MPGWDADKSTIMFESSRAAASEKQFTSFKKDPVNKQLNNDGDEVLLSNLVTDSGRRAEAPAEIHPSLDGQASQPPHQTIKPQGDNFLESNPEALDKISQA